MSLFVTDMIAIFCGFFAAHLYFPVLPEEHYLIISVALVPAYLLVAVRMRAYSVEVIQNSQTGRSRSVQSILIAASLILFVAFYAKQTEHFSRVVFGVGILNSVITISLLRALFARHTRSLLEDSPFGVVLISDNIGTAIAQGFSAVYPASEFDPKGDCPFMYDRLAIALKDADRVVVSCPPDRRMIWVNALKGSNVRAEILVPELSETIPMAVAQYDGIPTIVVTKGPLSLPDRIAKRGFDIVTALFALIAFSPLFVFVAFAVKIETSGPVFFIQTRVGRGNELFKMVKFRSMHHETSDGQGERSTGRDDMRITTVGRFIRRTSIDELPQLLNVFWGHMSIVGPRPHALGSRAENLLFWEIDTRYRHRHSTKPGLTGLAQIRGYRGATSFRDDLTNRLDADLEYIDKWSLWRDFKIVLMTFKVMVHRNAY
jgi:exopolysaccharide biosynthesis polyprenyl glycosylphosphotransferase